MGINACGGIEDPITDPLLQKLGGEGCWQPLQLWLNGAHGQHNPSQAMPSDGPRRLLGGWKLPGPYSVLAASLHRAVRSMGEA